jgi:CHAT domain-containing protein
METLKLHIAKFNLFLETGQYDQAYEEINQAAAIAEQRGDNENHIMSLNNLGGLYSRLKQYDLALEHYQKARSLFTATSPTMDTRLLIYVNLADRFAAQNDSIQFRRIIKEAQEVLRLRPSPRWEALLLASLGDSYEPIKNYEAALKYYSQADSIFDQNGFRQSALSIRIPRVDCLIALSRLSEAKVLLAEAEQEAKEIDDVESLIDAHGRAVQIQYLEGDIAQAIASSNRLRHEIEQMSLRFRNPARLLAYRQKVYDWLKFAVLCEMAHQQPEAALARLDDAKAYALKNRLLNVHTDFQGHAAPRNDLNLELAKSKFNEKTLLINYMLTPDSLYAFVLGQGNPQLLRKKFDSETLRKTVYAYRDSIAKTAYVFQNYSSRQVNSHYAGTVTLAQQLYQDLLGWPEIESQLQEAEWLYITPDDFLYEVPFSTLIADRADPQTFLAKQAAVGILPSLGLSQNEKPANGVAHQLKTKRVLISADKRFPGAGKFVKMVKTLFPLAEELAVQDSAITKEKVLAQLDKDYQLYIFLGHGHANSQYPERGYIEVSVNTPNASTQKMMRLNVADLKNCAWQGTEMVMLIGCETASGRLYRGSGISGLQQEFLALGVNKVLGNLWEVDATHAISQAQNFLAAWASLGNPALALQASQHKALQELQKYRYYQQPHPYFWGSAVLLTATSH